MGDYSLGGGFSGGYGSGGLGLGGGYGGNSGYGSSSGLGLGGGGYSGGGGWGGGYGLADGYSGGGYQGLQYGGDYGPDGAMAPGFWDSAPSTPSYGGGGFSSPGYAPASSGFSGYGFSAPQTSSYGLQTPGPSTPSFNGSIGLQAPRSSTLGTGGEDGGFGDSEFGRTLKKMGLWAANRNPTASRALGAYGAAKAIGDGEYGQGLGTLTSMVSKNPVLGGIVGLGIDAAQGKPMGERGASTIGGTLGGIVGGIAGPFGGILGSELGQRMGGAIARGETTPARPTPSQRMGNEGGRGDGGLDNYIASPEVQRALDSIKDPAARSQAQKDPIGAILGGLMGVYGVNRMKQTADGQRRAFEQQNQQQQASLAGLMSQVQGHAAPRAPGVHRPNFGGISAKLDKMFGPKSGVALEMRSQLERKDAAAGRRSQYGPREAQLMAALTQLRAQAEPSYMNAEVAAANTANQMAASIYGTQAQGHNSQLQQLIGLQGAMGNTNSQALANQFKAQQEADQRRQQTLATLYSMGKDSGAFSWLGNQASSWWNGQ